MKKNIALWLLALTFGGLVTVSAAAQTARQFTIDELMKVRRVGDPQISPDGRTVAFAVGDVNLDANKVVNQIYTVGVDGGGQPRQLTNGKSSASSPRWSSDGKRIAYNSGGQIYTMNADGSNAKQITAISSGASGAAWSPDGKMIAFVSDVYPECNGDDACNKQKDTDADNSKVKAHVTDRLLYRHWTEWRERKRTHVFIVDANNGGTAREVTTGDFDAPPYGASTGVDYAFSPDSKEIAFLRNPDKVEAVSTNSDIYTIAVDGTSNDAKNITVNNKGYDASPYYTPDGKFIVYRSQASAGVESDRWRLTAFNRQTGESRELTQNFDLQVEDVCLAPDGGKVYFTAGERASQNVYVVPMTGGAAKKLGEVGFVSDLKITRDGKTLVFNHSDGKTPNEIAKMSVDGRNLTKLTHVNDALMQSYKLQKLEDFNWTGAENAKVHGLITKPANFDPNKKYPLFVLIHGGPQSANNNSWSYRWNAQVFANQGYIVFAPNPRGSTGYGQKFVNEVSQDWGGRAFVDITEGVAALLKDKNYIDRERIGAGGASYGGYMVDWIMGHNDDARFKFKVFLSHAGVYNLESMAGATEELWFVNQEFNGAPWQNPELYNKWSPNKFAAKFDTPTLVTGGELDFRVPVDQDLQLYTALQLKNIESKLIIFPDEGHWILKPQNSKFWYGNVTDWFNKHLNP